MHKTRWIPLSEIDLVTGVREFEEAGAADDAADAEKLALTGGSPYYKMKMRLRAMIPRKQNKEI